MPSMEDACKNACKDDAGLSKDGFLCSGRYVDQLNFISQYGYDPCTGDEVGFDDTAAGLSLGQSDVQWERLQPVLIGLFILIAAGLAVLFIAKT
ncbi:MAG: hypothetical protein KDC54_12525 [Lewinella sp.]|nr:hypothetical protein [Lewinella sp.]